MSLFIPLRKVDAAQRLVYGQIDETPDRSGEVFDYASSKPYFLSWSRDAYKATNGKSYGNIRAMHGKVAAGKLEGIHFNDASKSIQLVARIVDDAEWEKVEQGVYTGFSPGGSYVKRWQDNGLSRYTAQPSEISIVDLPCIPSAGFTMVKADGVEERRSFARAEAASAVADPAAPLRKAGKRNSKEDQDRIQAMHDTAVALGACCGTCQHEAAPAAPVEKAMGGGNLAKALGELDQAKGEIERLTKLAGDRNRLAKRVAELEAMPAPGGPVLRVLSKEGDTTILAAPDPLAKAAAEATGPDKALALIKLAQRSPVVRRY